MGMEIELRNGRIAQNGLGLPKTAAGRAAALQRAENRIRAARGAFPYDRTLGSRILSETGEEHLAAFGLAAAREAVFPEAAVKAVSASAAEDAVTVRLECGGESREITVRTGGTE